MKPNDITQVGQPPLAGVNTPPVKTPRQFMFATEAMMHALDAADGMSPHELRCFLPNTQQFVANMIERSQAEETARKYPMGRYNWGKHEHRESRPSALPE